MNEAALSPTRRLYLADASVLEFEALVLAAERNDAGSSIVLAESAFYPEAGGQLADQGTLALDGRAPWSVVDVQIDDAGVVRHAVALDASAELPQVGAVVRGRVEVSRRREHSALHTAQHMLSRALLDEAGAATVSARLGATACTIDLSLAEVSDAALARAEALVNAVIDDDRPIRAYFPEPAELAKLPLRREPKVTENVRVVDIDGFDVSPCGGTHATRTSQVHQAKLVGVERYKGKLRVSFTAGPRARRELGHAFDTLSAIARRLTCGADAIQATLDKAQRALQEERLVARQHASELATEKANALAATLAPGSIASLDWPTASVEVLRVAAGHLVARQLVAVLAGAPTSGEQRAFVVACPPNDPRDAGALLRALATRAGGRGGGRKHHAEGTLPIACELGALLASASEVLSVPGRTPPAEI
ncbi:MAG: alanyl-tRNA editing protein [Polyangiaceae bacterium]